MTKAKKIVYYDCFSGICGDMHLGALIDLGVDVTYLTNELHKLNLDGWSLQIMKSHKKGIWGTNVKVLLAPQKPASILLQHAPHQQHRGYREIEALINASALHENIKNIALSIFLKIGEAEAKIHNKTIDEIHFHEVGAVDSIIDIVGAAICIDYLKPDYIYSSIPELGGGFVKCAHGLIPVPAPAVVEILKGIPVKTGAVPFETTTPTGAAILACVVNHFSDKQNFTIEKIGYGVGERDTDIPNVLRVMLGVVDDKQSPANKVCLIECNIDDMNPELFDFAFEKLFAQGVMDVYLTPIIMKKARPANTLSVLCSYDIKEIVKEIIFTHTTTLGVRETEVYKTDLHREVETIETAYGPVRIKHAYLNNKKISSKPEYDDCKKLALEHNISIKEIYQCINLLNK